ncbi:hypothetical protein [Thermocatellispora tengchongensis]|uniref:hypothetical protein n=1 Tax=Thermocatellispora tengchongensis TaxID=1073253 RepID=UPI00363EC198
MSDAPHPQVTVPWATSPGTGDSDDVLPLELPTENPTGVPSVAVPTLTAAPTVPPVTPTRTAPARKRPTAGPSARPTVTVTTTRKPTERPKPSASAKPTPTRTVTKTPTVKPKPTPTKTEAEREAAAAQASNPYSPQQVCNSGGHGSGFYVQRSASFSGGTTYQLYSASSGYNCVVTMKTTDIGKATEVWASLEAQGGGSDSDRGSYKYYAGPVMVYAKGKCVKFAGGGPTDSTGGDWANCG